jgi:hypothetical protein
MTSKKFKSVLRVLCTIALVFVLATSIVEILIHLA